eukprot:Hpha_TRINITY_DN9497_c0_g1::TRINITY_DN9497_c0_g1_i2::g.139237::m.139237
MPDGETDSSFSTHLSAQGDFAGHEIKMKEPGEATPAATPQDAGLKQPSRAATEDSFITHSSGAREILAMDRPVDPEEKKEEAEGEEEGEDDAFPEKRIQTCPEDVAFMPTIRQASQFATARRDSENPPAAAEDKLPGPTSTPTLEITGPDAKIPLPDSQNCPVPPPPSQQATGNIPQLSATVSSYGGALGDTLASTGGKMKPGRTVPQFESTSGRRPAGELEPDATMPAGSRPPAGEPFPILSITDPVVVGDPSEQEFGSPPGSIRQASLAASSAPPRPPTLNFTEVDLASALVEVRAAAARAEAAATAAATAASSGQTPHATAKHVSPQFPATVPPADQLALWGGHSLDAEASADTRLQSWGVDASVELRLQQMEARQRETEERFKQAELRHNGEREVMLRELQEAAADREEQVQETVVAKQEAAALRERLANIERGQHHHPSRRDQGAGDPSHVYRDRGAVTPSSLYRDTRQDVFPGREQPQRYTGYHHPQQYTSAAEREQPQRHSGYHPQQQTYHQRSGVPEPWTPSRARQLPHQPQHVPRLSPNPPPSLD